MTYHAELSREEERFLGIVSDPETVQGKRDIISRRKPSRLEMRMKVVAHLHDRTTPEVDLLRVSKVPKPQKTKSVLNHRKKEEPRAALVRKTSV